MNYKRAFQMPQPGSSFVYMGTIDTVNDTDGAAAIVDVYYWPEKRCVGIRVGAHPNADWHGNLIDVILREPREPFIAQYEIDAAKHILAHPIEDCDVIGLEEDGKTLVYWNRDDNTRYVVGDTLVDTEFPMNEIEYVRAGGDPEKASDYVREQGWKKGATQV